MTSKITWFVIVLSKKNKKYIQFFRERLSEESVSEESVSEESMSEVQGITPKGIAGSFYVMVRLDLRISGKAKKMPI